MNSRSATAPCWRPAASISCRCWKAWRCPTIFPPPPIRKARPAGSTCSPASSPTRPAASTGIEAGYHGPLYAEISPRTFPVLVREGSRLSQIRFRRGHALLGAEALRELHARERLVDADDADVSEGVAVGVDLSGSRRQRAAGRRRLSRQAPHRTDRCGAARRLCGARFLGADAGAPRQEPDPRSQRVLHPGVEGSGAGAARLRRRDGAVRSAGRRIPRALCRLLRSRLRLCRRRRQGRARGAGSALARGAVHPGARPDRRAAGLREDDGAARQALWHRHRLELPGAEPEAVASISRASGR